MVVLKQIKTTKNEQGNYEKLDMKVKTKKQDNKTGRYSEPGVRREKRVENLHPIFLIYDISRVAGRNHSFVRDSENTLGTDFNTSILTP